MKKDKKDLKDLEFLAEKSRQLLEKQITSYRQKHSNAGPIITVLALFIPFFLNGLDDSYIAIKLIALIPIGLLIWAIILLLQVLRSKSLDHGFHISKFDTLVNKSYSRILLYEIGANKSSFKDNQSICKASNNSYDKAIRFTVISIILSTFLLLFNEFFQPEKKPTDVVILNKKDMSKKNNNNKDSSKDKRVIPYVPSKERTKLNEGVNKSNALEQKSEKGK